MAAVQRMVVREGRWPWTMVAEAVMQSGKVEKGMGVRALRAAVATG